MPHRRLGQHFLTHASILERIAVAACPEPCGLVVEIGPGRGALTQRLLARSSRVVAIEIDRELAAGLREKYAGDPRLEVIEADILATDLGRWPGATIAGNLPYYITSPILERALRARPPRAVFLVQKEVAARMAAAPGSRDFGLLTVRVATHARARVLFEVKPGAFHPPPEVDSAVVLLEPAAPPPGIDDTEAFLRFAGVCFRHKRKTLRNNLAEAYGRTTVDAWPEAGLRAEQLSVAQLAEIYGRLPAHA